MKHRVGFIAAIDNNLGLAKNGVLPWDLPTDRKYFRDHVEEGPVIMGWNTLAANGLKPYGRGKNYVLSHKTSQAAGVEIISDVHKFFSSLNEDIWVVGGGQVFKETLPYATHLYLTQVNGDFACDVFFPEYEKEFELIKEAVPQVENKISFKYQIWQRK